MLIIPNCRFIHPYTEEVDITVMPNDDTIPDVDSVTYPLLPSRPSQHYSQIVANETVITLPWTPLVPSWTEIYLDGIRIIDISTDFGINYNQYTIVNNIITFSDPITGTVDVFCDTAVDPVVRAENRINVDNIQGADAVPTDPGQTFAATWCEPIICAQPFRGYARLSDDRKSIIYVPNQNFQGSDAFSYALISQRGQLSKPKCVYVTVAPPPAPPEPPTQ